MRARFVLFLSAAMVCAVSATAIENYAGTMTGQCVKQGGFTYNVVATVKGNWTMEGLQYSFSQGPIHKSIKPNAQTQYFLVNPGPQQVKVGNPQFQATHDIEVPKCDLVVTGDGFVGTNYDRRYDVTFTDGTASAAKGMTWSFLGANAVNGTAHVGCKVGCDPYKGDTPCTTPLPLLCIRKSGAGFPLPPPAGFNNNDQYNKWGGGIIGTTAAIAAPSTLAAANQACAAAFGTDWRVASFHDGAGWTFWAFGGVGNPAGRFRVHIKDQPANCWQ